MSPAKIDLSIVVVSYNTREMLKQCLIAAGVQTSGLAAETIVVDNGSADGTVEMIESAFPAVRLIRNGRNVGFAAGQNQGILAAAGEFVLVLNSDVILGHNSVSALYAYMSERRAVGLAGPRVVNSDGSLAPSARRLRLSRLMLALSVLNRHFRFSQWVPQRFLRTAMGGLLGKVHDNFWPHEKVSEVEAVDGMCCLARRAALDQAGLFDERFFIDFEILDLCRRITSHGWRIVYYPLASVTHVSHSSRRKVRWAVIETTKSELAYYAKNYPDQLEYLRRLTVAVTTVKLALCWLVKAVRPRPERSERFRIVQECLRAARSFTASSGGNHGAQVAGVL